MSDKTHEKWEDEQILRALDDMAAGAELEPRDVLAGPDAEAGGLRRVYAEALCLLPYELDALSPPPELKARVLGEVAGLPQRTPERPSEDDRVRAGSRSPQWLMPLAATLALVLVGVTGWQIWRVEKQAETIAWLLAELEESRMATAELAAAREMVAETRARLEMMTASTAEFCALKPTVSCPNQQARGTIVMQKGRSDWFLRVEGLGPCEEGRQYKLWFVTDLDANPVLGASFAVEGSHDLVEIRATGAPAGVKAVMITLEEPGVEAAPEAEVLLYGDQTMRVL